jgi:predicted choloylglycine hydrolase
MTVHVAYLEDSFVELNSAPHGIPCLESFKSRDGCDVLLYKADDFSELKKLSRFQQSKSSLQSDLDISRHLRLKRECRAVFVIRKLQGSKVLFSTVPAHMVLTSSAYVNVAALHTDGGNYVIKLLDFNPAVRDCQLCLIYQDIETLSRGDMLDVTLQQALSV